MKARGKDKSSLGIVLVLALLWTTPALAGLKALLNDMRWKFKKVPLELVKGKEPGELRVIRLYEKMLEGERVTLRGGLHEDLLPCSGRVINRYEYFSIRQSRGNLHIELKAPGDFKHWMHKLVDEYHHSDVTVTGLIAKDGKTVVVDGYAVGGATASRASARPTNQRDVTEARRVFLWVIRNSDDDTATAAATILERRGLLDQAIREALAQ